MVTSPWMKRRLRSPVTRIGSLIAEHLDRIGTGRLISWVEGREEREHQRDDDDGEDLHGIWLRRKVGQEADRWVPEVLSGHRLDRVDYILPEVQEDGAEDDAEHNAERTDGHADGHENLHHPAPARAYGPQDRDVAGLGANQHDQRRQDVEHRDEDDQREDDEHRHAFDLKSLEQSRVHLPPVDDHAASLDQATEWSDDLLHAVRGGSLNLYVVYFVAHQEQL